MPSTVNDQSETSCYFIKNSCECTTPNLLNNNHQITEEKKSDLGVSIDENIEVSIEDSPKPVCLTNNNSEETNRKHYGDICSPHEGKVMDSSHDITASSGYLSKESSASYSKPKSSIDSSDVSTANMPKQYAAPFYRLDSVSKNTNLEIQVANGQDIDHGANNRYYITDDPIEYFSKCVSIFKNTDDNTIQQIPTNAIHEPKGEANKLYGIQDGFVEDVSNGVTIPSYELQNTHRIPTRELHGIVNRDFAEEQNRPIRYDKFCEDTSKDTSTLSNDSRSIDDIPRRFLHNIADHDFDAETNNIMCSINDRPSRENYEVSSRDFYAKANNITVVNCLNSSTGESSKDMSTSSYEFGSTDDIPTRELHGKAYRDFASEGNYIPIVYCIDDSTEDSSNEMPTSSYKLGSCNDIPTRELHNISDHDISSYNISNYDLKNKESDLTKVIKESLDKLTFDTSPCLDLLQNLGLEPTKEIPTEQNLVTSSYKNNEQGDGNSIEIIDKPRIESSKYPSFQSYLLEKKKEISTRVESVDQSHEDEAYKMLQIIDETIVTLSEKIPTPLVDTVIIKEEQNKYKKDRFSTYKYPLMSLTVVFLAASIITLTRNTILFNNFPYFAAIVNCLGGMLLTKKSLDKIALYIIPRMEAMENIAFDYVQKAYGSTANAYDSYSDYISRQRSVANKHIATYSYKPRLSSICKQMGVFEVDEKKLIKDLDTERVLSQLESNENLQGNTILIGNKNIPRSFRGHYMFRILVTMPVLTGIFILHTIFVWVVKHLLNSFQAVNGDEINNRWSPLIVAIISGFILCLQVMMTKFASKASRVANMLNKHLVKRETSIDCYRSSLRDTMKFIRTRTIHFVHLVSSIISLSRVQSFHSELIIDSIDEDEENLKKARRAIFRKSFMYSLRARKILSIPDSGVLKITYHTGNYGNDSAWVLSFSALKNMILCKGIS